MKQSWQTALTNAITTPAELFQLLRLDPALLPAAEAAARLFPLRVPRAFVSRMTPGDPDDPLLRQVLPLAAETRHVPGYISDPLAESRFNPLPGLLHKYHGRVLLTVSGACGIHCRYCFRRDFPYANNQLGPASRQALLAYLAADPSLTEVILSGGDPLVASDSLLSELVSQLADIPHLKRLRIHARLPVMVPERLTSACLEWLTASRLQPVLVLHCNHPRELTQALGSALRPFRGKGVTVLNQSVLLRGINDSADILAQLSESLFATGILPYYLHVPDPVAGTAHFDLPHKEAIQLHNTLRSRLPGYLLPRLVTEIAGQAAKTPLFPKNLYTGQS